jgi:uncharacterized membrane protein
MTAPRTRLSGWTVFAGIMLILAGAEGVLTGLWALDNENEAINTIFFDNEIETWGWIYLVAGIVLLLAGIAVVNGREWGRVVGIIAAGLWVIVRLPWIFTYPAGTVLSIALGVIVIYGLAVEPHQRS